jgi:hypothetical protein
MAISPPPSPPAPESRKEAKARAKAEKAYAKANRPWYKKPLFIVLIAIAAIVLIAAISSGGESDTDTAESNGATADTADSGTDAAGIGDAVRDGKFEFVVDKVDCGATKAGKGFMAENAQGQFCFVSMSIENIGDESQAMFADNQYMYDEQGREFAADFDATFALGNKGQMLFEEINPGNAIEGIVVFDVPKAAKPISLELHDSMLSDGVSVSID